MPRGASGRSYIIDVATMQESPAAADVFPHKTKRNQLRVVMVFRERPSEQILDEILRPYGNYRPIEGGGYGWHFKPSHWGIVTSLLAAMGLHELSFNFEEAVEEAGD